MTTECDEKAAVVKIMGTSLNEIIPEGVANFWSI